MEPDDVRVEYTLLAAYTNSIVVSRFTVAGLYMAGAGFMAAAALRDDVSWTIRIALSVMRYF